MSVCEQSSQRATWPPRAAVRQLSIADITLNWPRLTLPALALRHAGPWPRKISATSSAGRDMRCALAWRLVLRGAQRRQAIQRAHDFANGVGGNTGIERGGLELGVPKQDLDHPNINVLLKQVGCEAMAQGVRRH